MKERTMTLACGALCALVFVSALFTPGQARGAAFAEPADATELPVLMVDPTPTLTASPVPTVSPYPGWTKEEVEMLACAIYQEAGGDACCDLCRHRVGDVILNRMEDDRFPDTVEEVLTAYRQYGRFYWTGVVWPDRAVKPGEAHAVARAWETARDVLSGEHSDLYGQGYIYQAEFEQGADVIYCEDCGIYFGR